MADEPRRSRRQALADLAPRALSALALMPVAVAAAWLGGPYLAGAAGAAVVIMTYEWARMSQPGRLPVAWAIAFVGAFVGVVAASVGDALLGVAFLAVAGLVAGLAAPSRERALAAFGAVYIALPPTAFLWLRQQDPGGAAVVLTLFAVIWAADMAAYFGGRLIGGPAFLPRVSPSKTWAGVLCGLAAATAAGSAAGLVVGGPPTSWAVVGAALGALGLAGDVLESSLKRRYGVKDASRIIPGHGGMLDRLDGLMLATLGAAIAVLAAPGLLGALLGGGP